MAHVALSVVNCYFQMGLSASRGPARLHTCRRVVRVAPPQIRSQRLLHRVQLVQLGERGLRAQFLRCGIEERLVAARGGPDHRSLVDTAREHRYS